MGAVGTVFGGKEKGVEGRDGSLEKEQGLSKGSVGQGRCEGAMDQY